MTDPEDIVELVSPPESPERSLRTQRPEPRTRIDSGDEDQPGERPNLNGEHYQPAPRGSQRELGQENGHRPERPQDPASAILNAIHGPERPQESPPRPKDAVRKGLGWAWTPEDEEFLIRLIGEYGCAWADIARYYCRPGARLEGRDQVKLKDKARNLKLAMIRFVYILVLWLVANHVEMGGNFLRTLSGSRLREMSNWQD